jgi:hypothetical protein
MFRKCTLKMRSRSPSQRTCDPKVKFTGLA